MRLHSTFVAQPCHVIDAPGREVLRVQVGYDTSLDLVALNSGRYLLRSDDAVVLVQVLR